jgi:hypothetical protein
MAHVTIEYVILLPLLILQIFIFPYAANLMMNGWTDSRRTIALQETAGHLGSSVQQTYLSLDYPTIPTANVTNKIDIPPFIEGYAYNVTGTANSSRILQLNLKLKGAAISASVTVSLVPNVNWINSTFMSDNLTSVYLHADKHNGEIDLYFGS